MKNLLSLIFILVLSASVALAQSNANEETNSKEVKVEQTSKVKAGCAGMKAKSGCCKKKSSAQAMKNCHGKAEANAACCDKHASEGVKEEDDES